jgi:hypothetical protein
LGFGREKDRGLGAAFGNVLVLELLRKGGSVVALRFFEAVTSSIVTTLRKANAHLARLAAERPSAAASTRHRRSSL